MVDDIFLVAELADDVSETGLLVLLVFDVVNGLLLEGELFVFADVEGELLVFVDVEGELLVFVDVKGELLVFVDVAECVANDTEVVPFVVRLFVFVDKDEDDDRGKLVFFVFFSCFNKSESTSVSLITSKTFSPINS